jgi:hypothetical protein
MLLELLLLVLFPSGEDKPRPAPEAVVRAEASSLHAAWRAVLERSRSERADVGTAEERNLLLQFGKFIGLAAQQAPLSAMVLVPSFLEDWSTELLHEADATTDATRREAFTELWAALHVYRDVASAFSRLLGGMSADDTRQVQQTVFDFEQQLPELLKSQEFLETLRFTHGIILAMEARQWIPDEFLFWARRAHQASAQVAAHQAFVQLQRDLAIREWLDAGATAAADPVLIAKAHPVVIERGDSNVHVTWDDGSRSTSLDVWSDGSLEWFYLHRPSGEYGGSDGKLLRSLPPTFFEKLGSVT